MNSNGGLPDGNPLLPANEHDYMRLTMRSLGMDDPGVEYYHAVNETFAFIFNDYAYKCDYDSCHMRFQFGNMELTRNQSPQQVGMENEAVAYVYGRVLNMKLNTYFKVFVVQECDDIPLELNFRVKTTVHMDRVYKVWASHIYSDDTLLVSIRKSRVKPRVGFVHESGIRNDDRLFSMLLVL